MRTDSGTSAIPLKYWKYWLVQDVTRYCLVQEVGKNKKMKFVVLLSMMVSSLEVAAAPLKGTGKKVVILHVPKTGGTSFYADVQTMNKERRTMNRSVTSVYKLNDAAHIDMRTFNPAKIMYATFIRHPYHHVLSMFLECKYGHWPKGRVPGYKDKDVKQVYSGFEVWVNTFATPDGTFNRCRSDKSVSGQPGVWTGQPTPDCRDSPERNVDMYDFNCYNPWNMQSRYVAGVNGHHAEQTQLVPNVTRACGILDDYGFVGVTALYQESLCIFQYRVNGILPEACKCSNHETLATTHDAHYTPRHSWDEVSPEVQSRVAKLVQADVKLFAHALKRFEIDLLEVESSSNTKILCEPLRLSELQREAHAILSLNGGRNR